MNIFKKISVSFVVVALVMTPFFAGAQTVTGEIDWGGLHLVTLDQSVCTCSGNSTWILDYKTNSLLTLYYQEGQSFLYTNYNIRGTYQVGTYSQGGQPCSIQVYSTCVDLTNMGTYGKLPGTGTSLTKSNSAGIVELFRPYEPTKPPQGSYFASLKNTSRGVFKGLSI